MATATSPDIGTNAITNIDGEQIRVQVCGWDERRGYRVSNRQWGGKVATWVQDNELTAASGPHN